MNDAETLPAGTMYFQGYLLQWGRAMNDAETRLATRGRTGRCRCFNGAAP